MFARNGPLCPAGAALRYRDAAARMGGGPSPKWVADRVSRHPARHTAFASCAVAGPAHEVVAMSTADPQAPSKPRASLWMRELPFTVVLILTILGVAYTSFSKQPIIAYWEILAPIIGVMCIAYGWNGADDRAARVRLIVTQVVHWIAFLVVLYMRLM